MKPGTPQFVAGRLLEAREARGLSAAALAGLVDVRRETIYQIEAGRITPGPALFDRLQQALVMPPAFFLDSDDALAGDEVALFRSLSSATKPARQRALRRLQWLRRIAGLVDEFVNVPNMDIPDFQLPSDPTSIANEQIESAAEDLRESWALGNGPLDNITWLMENHGVMIAREDLGAEALDAALLQSDNQVFVLLGSDKGTNVRSRMDAGHELGHVILHRHATPPKSDKDPRHKLMEQQAFRFASAFLLPAEPFAADIFMCSLEELLAIKPKWKVSVAAMIMRALQLDLISDDHALRLRKTYSSRRWNRSEPFDDEWVPEQPVFLRRSLELMLREGVVSKDRILNDVKLTAIDIEDLTGLPRGAISDGPIPISFRELGSDREQGQPNIVPFRSRPEEKASREIS